MDYMQFSQNISSFRPCAFEDKQTRRMNGSLVQKTCDVAKAKIRSWTAEQAMDFLNDMVEHLNDGKSLGTLVNEDPQVAMTEYDDSRLNIKVDMMLLEVAEALYQCRPPNEQMSKFDQLMAKLRVIRKLRAQMWEYHRLQHNLIPGEGVFDDVDDTRDRQRALLRLLLNLRMDGAHKRLDVVCFEKVVAGHATGYFQPRQTIESYVYDSCNQHLDRELWRLLTSDGNTIAWTINHLTKHNSMQEFPVVQPTPGWYSFKNGTYDAFADTFWPYTHPNRPTVCTVHYIDSIFNAANMGRWEDIATPSITKILEDQKLPPAVQRWVWILLGRTLYPLKSHDRWEVTLYFQGEALSVLLSLNPEALILTINQLLCRCG